MAEELIDSEGDFRAPRDVDAMRGTILVSTFRWLRELAGTLGATPFTPLARAAKVYARNFRGGAIAVSRVADTEARFEVRGAPRARSRVHRDTIEGSLLDGCLPFTANAKVSEIIASRSPTSYAYRIRW